MSDELIKKAWFVVQLFRECDAIQLPHKPTEEVLTGMIDRIEALEAKLAKAAEVLERISEHDHQRTAENAIRYFLPTNNTGAVQEALMSVASTDMQAWVRTTLAELKGEN